MAGVVPNETVDPELNPLPEIVTFVPPVAGPEVGESPEIVDVYVNLRTGFSYAITPSTRTYTGTLPVPEGMLAVIEVPEVLTLIGVTFVVPTSTNGAEPNSFPVIVILVPIGPELGSTELTFGEYVKSAFGVLRDVPLLVVTVTATWPVPGGDTAVISVSLFTVKLADA